MTKFVQMLLLLVLSILLVGCSQVNNVLQSNINPETGDPYTNTHLPLYSCQGDLETVKKLIDLGLDYQIDNALDCAVDSNNLELVEFLVESGADIHVETTGGTNLLFAAIQRGSYDVVPYFLEAGLDPYEADSNNLQIFHHIIYDTDFDEPESILRMLTMLETLQGYEVNMSDMKIGTGISSSNIDSPVLYAIRVKNPLLLDIALTLGMNLDLTPAEEQTFIEDFRYELSGNDRVLACLMYSKGDIPIYNTTPGIGYGKIEMYLPDCALLLTEYYEEYGLQNTGATSQLINSTIPDELLEAEANHREKVRLENEAYVQQKEQERQAILEAEAEKALEVENEQREAEEAELEANAAQENEGDTSSPSMPITAEEAKQILQDAFPDFSYYSGGSLSEEEFHEGKLTTEPAYMFVFTEDATGEPYVGWVFGDGNYKLRATMWGDE